MSVDEAIGVALRRALLIRYAEDLEAEIAQGNSDPDVLRDAIAAKAQALALESH